MRRRSGPFYNCPMGTRVRHAVARGPDEPVADLTEHDVVHRGMRVDLERLARAVRDLSPTSRISDTGRRRPAPLAAGLRGDWRTAAAGWTELGEQCESALELAEWGAIDETLEALRILDRLGATAAALMVRRRLKDLGVRAIPRGPMARTRANPAGLTPRELDVLALIAGDLTNATPTQELRPIAPNPTSLPSSPSSRACHRFSSSSVLRYPARPRAACCGYRFPRPSPCRSRPRGVPGTRLLAACRHYRTHAAPPRPKGSCPARRTSGG